MRLWSFATTSILFRVLLPPLQLLLHIRHSWTCIADVLHLIRLELELFQFERWICMQIHVPTFFFFSSLETPLVVGIAKLPSLITSRQSEHPEAFHSASVCWIIYWTWTELEICSSSSTQKLILKFFSFSLADCISGNIRIRTQRLEVIDTLLKKWRKNFLRGCVDIYFCTPALTHSMTMCVRNGIRNANLVYFPSINLCYCALVFLFFIRSFRHNSKRVWVVV